MQIIIDNFSIRQVAVEDAEKYFSLIDNNRAEFEVWFPGTARGSSDLESTKEHLAKRLTQAEKKEFFLYIITENSTKKIIGGIFIKDISREIGRGFIGYYIDKTYQGKGIGSKCVGAMIEYFFNEMKLNKICIQAGPDNIASQRVAEKNNFTKEGILRSEFKTYNGTLRDLIHYGLLRSEFENFKK